MATDDGTAEHRRLEEAKSAGVPWRKWGPYLSERQWGTVREDYSDSGDAWAYFSHDQARSRAYRWGEDGLAGISDDWQLLCFALALWNGRDPILKERLFGLTNSEGNHGEDVKECYFYLDSTPTHSYMKYLYKYPQAAYPYSDLVDTNARKPRTDFEYELLDTGVFDERPLLRRVRRVRESRRRKIFSSRSPSRTAGKAAAALHVLPTLWFRNTWSWSQSGAARPSLKLADTPNTVAASHPELGTRYLVADGAAAWLFTENETNHARLERDAERHAVRQGRVRQLHRPGRSEGGESGSDRHEGCGALRGERGRRRDGRAAAETLGHGSGGGGGRLRRRSECTPARGR